MGHIKSTIHIQYSGIVFLLRIIQGVNNSEKFHTGKNSKKPVVVSPKSFLSRVRPNPTILRSDSSLLGGLEEDVQKLKTFSRLTNKKFNTQNYVHSFLLGLNSPLKFQFPPFAFFPPRILKSELPPRIFPILKMPSIQRNGP